MYMYIEANIYIYENMIYCTISNTNTYNFI